MDGATCHEKSLLIEDGDAFRPLSVPFVQCFVRQENVYPKSFSRLSTSDYMYNRQALLNIRKRYICNILDLPATPPPIRRLQKRCVCESRRGASVEVSGLG